MPENEDSIWCPNYLTINCIFRTFHYHGDPYNGISSLSTWAVNQPRLWSLLIWYCWLPSENRKGNSQQFLVGKIFHHKWKASDFITLPTPSPVELPNNAPLPHSLHRPVGNSTRRLIRKVGGSVLSFPSKHQLIEKSFGELCEDFGPVGSANKKNVDVDVFWSAGNFASTLTLKRKLQMLENYTKKMVHDTPNMKVYFTILVLGQWKIQLSYCWWFRNLHQMLSSISEASRRGTCRIIPGFT